LRNFETDARWVKVSDSLAIRPIRDDDLGPLGHRAPEVQFMLALYAGVDISGITHIVVSDYAPTHAPVPADMVTSEGSELARTRVQALVTALRLTGRGDVGLLGMRAGRDAGGGGIGQPCGDELVPRGRNPYRLSHGEERVRTLSDLTDTLSREPGSLCRLRMALRRFNLSYGRLYFDDRLVDLVTALEAALLPGGRGELKFRLQLRAAAVLASHTCPADTKELLSAMYDMRSAIVHEGCGMHSLPKKLVKRIELNHHDPWVFVTECEDVARRILRECVSVAADGTAPRDFASQLDQQAFDGLATD